MRKGMLRFAAPKHGHVAQFGSPGGVLKRRESAEIQRLHWRSPLYKARVGVISPDIQILAIAAIWVTRCLASMAPVEVAITLEINPHGNPSGHSEPDRAFGVAEGQGAAGRKIRSDRRTVRGCTAQSDCARGSPSNDRGSQRGSVRLRGGRGQSPLTRALLSAGGPVPGQRANPPMRFIANLIQKFAKRPRILNRDVYRCLSVVSQVESSGALIVSVLIRQLSARVMLSEAHTQQRARQLDRFAAFIERRAPEVGFNGVVLHRELKAVAADAKLTRVAD